MKQRGMGKRRNEKQKKRERKGMWIVQYYIKSKSVILTLLIMYGFFKQNAYIVYLSFTAVGWTDPG